VRIVSPAPTRAAANSGAMTKSQKLRNGGWPTSDVRNSLYDGPLCSILRPIKGALKTIHTLLTLLLCQTCFFGSLRPQDKLIPVSVTCRKSLLQGSYVLQIKNTSNTPLQLWLQAKGRTTNFLLPAGKTEEFGWAQGYRFDARNLFLMGGEGYDSLRQRMPDVELNPVKVDLSREGGLSVSLAQSYLQDHLPKYVRLPIRAIPSGSLEFSLEEFPEIILNDGSERVFTYAIIQTSLLSGKVCVPLKVGVSFIPSYTPSTGEVIASQIQVENIDVNVPGSNIGLLPADWREQATKTLNGFLPMVFSQFVIYKVEKEWLINDNYYFRLATIIFAGCIPS
jgi:hypothetical protein